MKYLSLMIATFLAACTPLQPRLPVDAAPVTSPNGGQVMTAMGAVLTGRDWNNQPSEAKGNDDSEDDEDK